MAPTKTKSATLLEAQLKQLERVYDDFEQQMSALRRERAQLLADIQAHIDQKKLQSVYNNLK
ncbi:MAG: hypothetical protein KBB55_00285 [Candidatus Buchananbacteria bacterium]|nr:hypothetical protein [Candidatus Buchananbacteria bacterium]